MAIEVYAVLEQAMEMYKLGSISPGNLKGVTANRNITAFSIAMKIPFVVYMINKIKTVFLKFIYSYLSFLVYFLFRIIQSRASFIAVFIGFSTLISQYFKLQDKKNIKRFFINFFYIIPFILALFINHILTSDKGADAINRAATISKGIADNSINQRLDIIKM